MRVSQDRPEASGMWLDRGEEEAEKMRARRSIRLLGFSVALAVALPLAGAWTAWAASLNVYTAWAESMMAPLFKEYTAKTGVEINFLRLSGGEILARAVAERNNPRADVIFGAPADTFAAAKVEGILEPYRPPTGGKVPTAYKDREDFYHGFIFGCLAFMSNGKFLRERNLQPPGSWADLLDPAYKGQIQTADARTSGTAITRILSIYYAMGGNEDAAFDYQRKLHRNIQAYTKSGAGGTLPVGLGQAAVALVHLSEAMETKKKGYDVQVSFPKEGVTTAIEMVALLKGAKNRDLATKFIDWAMSPELQNLFAKYNFYVIPTHPEATLHPDVAQLMKGVKLLPMDLEWVGKNRKRLVDRWMNEVIKD